MDNIIAEAAKIERLTTQAAQEKAGNIIVATGRGGTGKSSFVALASRYLKPPLLLLDIDPDQSLGDMLGVDMETVTIKTETDREVKLKTLSEITGYIEDEDAFTELGGGPSFVKIPLLLKWYTQYTSERFDLISLGPRWTLGDYRSANFLFEFVIPTIGMNYANIIIDCPAGLEHLNRKVVSRTDDLFVIVDPSRKSIKHLERVRKITEQVGISYKHLYTVGSYEFDDEAEQRIKQSGVTYLGRMDYDAKLKDSNLKGESLFDLPDSSPACLSVKRILTKAGYKIGSPTDQA